MARFKMISRPELYLRWLLSFLAFCVLLPVPASFSHESIGSVSNAIITVRGSKLNYFLSFPPIVRTAMEQVGLIEDKQIREYISNRLHVSAANRECRLISSSAPNLQESGNFISHLVFDCPDRIKDLRVSSALFYDIDEKHIQFFRLVAHHSLEDSIVEAVLTKSNTDFVTSDVRLSSLSVFTKAYGFFRLGVEHILKGYDHILFLLCVILFAPSIIEAIKIVTSFTVAHSVTLGLAYMGVIAISMSIVEPLIALTIVYVGFENYFSKRVSGKRWLLVFVFGLIHGLGFVGVIKGITVSEHELLVALFSFNVGIEVGQIMIVIFFFTIVLYLRRFSWTPVFLRWSSVAMGLTGMIWFAQRVSGNG